MALNVCFSAAAREGGQQEEGVREMKRHREATLHRRVVRNELEEDEARADEGLRTDEAERSPREADRARALRQGDGGDDGEDQHEDEREPARHPVRELDERCELRLTLNDHAVTERPVRSAAVSREAGSNEGSPRDDREVIDQQTPCKFGERQTSHHTASDLPLRVIVPYM